MSTLTRRFEFRASDADSELIRDAAADAGLSISDYVRTRAVRDARQQLAQRRTTRVTLEHARAFYAALDDDAPVSELRPLTEPSEFDAR